MPAADLPAWIAGWRPPPTWSDSRNVLVARDDLPLTYAEVDHRYWVKSIEDALSDHAAAEPELDTHKCRFGLWYHGDGTQRYGHLAQFAAIGGLHEAAHATAARIVALLKDGNVEGARTLLDELRARRDALIGRLHALSGDHTRRIDPV